MPHTSPTRSHRGTSRTRCYERVQAANGAVPRLDSNVVLDFRVLLDVVSLLPALSLLQREEFEVGTRSAALFRIRDRVGCLNSVAADEPAYLQAKASLATPTRWPSAPLVRRGLFARRGAPFHRLSTPTAGPSWACRTSLPARAGQSRKRLISSARCRSLKPPTVFECAIRHRPRIRPALTDPILGSTKSRSRTGAVSTHAGGLARICANPIFPEASSFFSCARAERTSFACSSARRRCSRDRLGSLALTPSVCIERF